MRTSVYGKLSIDEISASSALLNNLKKEEYLLLWHKDTAGFTLVYRDEYNFKEYGKEPVIFGYLSGVLKDKAIKCTFTFDYLSRHVKVRKNMGGHNVCYFEDGMMLEIGGQELKMFDYIWVIDTKTFLKQIGLVVASNKAFMGTGKTCKFTLCRKLTDAELNVYQTECTNLRLLYHSSLTEKINKREIDRQYQIGDIYKNGDKLFICLGEQKLDIHVSYLKAKNYGLHIDEFNLIDYYAQKKCMWFICKWTEDTRLKQFVLTVLSGIPLNFSEFLLYEIMLAKMGSFKIRERNFPPIYSTLSGPINTLRYDLSEKMLGDKLSHMNININNLREKRFRSSTKGSKILMKIRDCIEFSIS